MELHPILEVGVCPSSNLWYVLSVSGSGPSMRVGHSATFIPRRHADEHDRVFVIGGGNPEQVFNEVYVLDLNLRSWDTLEAPGFKGRYEHAAFCVDNHPGIIFVFGGATQSGSLNDVQSLDVSSGIWSDVEVSGTRPAPRTHRSSAVIGSKVYFYSGGHIGPEPVADRGLHCLDTSTMTWASIIPRGDPPKPRHGHIMLALNNRIFLHGGMSGSTFYDDLFILDLDLNSWTSVKRKKTSPSPRAAHEGIVHNNEIYLFGGMSRSGALEDGYKLYTENNSWSKLMFDKPTPPNRLDFAMCRVKLRVPTRSHGSPQDSQTELRDASSKAIQILDDELKSESANSRGSSLDNNIVDQSVQVLDIGDPAQGQQPIIDSNCSGADNPQNKEDATDTEEVNLILINGGMDTEGEIFDDTLVLLL